MKRAPNGTPIAERTVEREVVEWRCEPLLTQEPPC